VYVPAVAGAVHSAATPVPAAAVVVVVGLHTFELFELYDQPVLPNP